MSEASDAKEQTPKDTKKKRRWPMHLLRVVLGVSVGLVITEFAFRTRDGGAFAHLNVYVPDAELGVRLKPGASEKIRFGSDKNPVSSLRINAEGYRGADWPAPSGDAAAAAEIVVVGDSQAFGLGVEDNETFSAALQTALAAKGNKAVVRNLGVPTYGPKEYNAVLAEQLKRRPAKTVIWVANMVNDLFEAGRPNKTRHVVWDGWAVRAESAPPKVTNFPGRGLLYTDSHAFLAFRRWMYERGPQDSDRGFASEGTWKDVGTAANEARNEHAGAELEAQRQAKLHANDVNAAKRAASLQTGSVDSMVLYDAPYDARGRDYGDHESDTYISSEQIFFASRLSPGDIVTAINGEVERDVKVNAEQIRRGVELRNRLEKMAREKAERTKDKKTLEAFAKREELDAKLSTLESEAPAKPIVLSPLTPALKEAKAICDAAGAKLFVVALPIDVQVSKDEWKKYNVENPVDMSPSRVLNEDVVTAALSIGADGLDALPALAAAEPGAFLDSDIHMTPKGHKALGEAIAKALTTPKLAKPDDALALPNKRSRPPLPAEWKSDTEIAVAESDPAGCETKQVREWVGIFCRGKGGAKGIVVDKGIEVLAGALPGEAVLIAPMIPGQDVHAVFSFGASTREFTAKMDGEKQVVAFGKPAAARADIPGPKEAEVGAYCACGKDCAKVTAPADADCTRTYANDCEKMLACAAGARDAAPTCGEGEAHAGAAQRCRSLCSKEVPCAKGTCTPWQGGNVCM